MREQGKREGRGKREVWKGRREEKTICQNYICGNVRAWQCTLLNTDALWFTPLEIYNAQFFMSGGSHGFQNYNGIHPFPRHLSRGYAWVHGKCDLFKSTHKRIIINI